jgi:hypothetical protein
MKGHVIFTWLKFHLSAEQLLVNKHTDCSCRLISSDSAQRDEHVYFSDKGGRVVRTDFIQRLPKFDLPTKIITLIRDRSQSQ